jgi:hypothetical protein
MLSRLRSQEKDTASRGTIFQASILNLHIPPAAMWKGRPVSSG